MIKNIIKIKSIRNINVEHFYIIPITFYPTALNVPSLLKKYNKFSFYESLRILLADKTKLFLIISIGFTSLIVYPFFIPHIGHPSMAYHIIIHIISLDIALFLTVISFISYNKTKSKKVLLTALSFVSLFIVEIIYLLQASAFMAIFYVPLIEVEFSHIMLSVMLVLFASGILKVDKK